MAVKKKQEMPKNDSTSERPTGFWLIKSKRECYSIDQFARHGKTLWTGIRNYQARNFMRTGMQSGDRFFFYHSNTSPAGIVGVGHVVKVNLPDPTALDKESDLYDPKASLHHPIWYCAEVAYEGHSKIPMTLEQIKGFGELTDMTLFRNGKRLSIVPVSKAEFLFILKRTGLKMNPN